MQTHFLPNPQIFLTQGCIRRQIIESQNTIKFSKEGKKSYLAERSATIIVGLITLFLISYDYN